MEALSMSSPLIHLPFPKRGISAANHKANLPCRCRRRSGHVAPTRIRAVDGAGDLAPVAITWQIALGALAGITPFVVAGIEFSKRIQSFVLKAFLDKDMDVELQQVELLGLLEVLFSGYHVAQRNCQVCGGSGLVLRDDYYTRCPGCGGFLPWRSWKRFFTG